MKDEALPDASIGFIECFDGAGDPELAFRQERQLEEELDRCRSEGHAGSAVALIGEAPRQRGADVAELLGKRRKVSVRFATDPFKETEKVAGVTSRDRAGVPAGDKFLLRVCPGRVRKAVAGWLRA